MLKVTVTNADGSSAEQTFDDPSREITVGRLEDRDVRVVDRAERPTVSRDHGAIVPIRGGFIYKDRSLVGSTIMRGNEEQGVHQASVELRDGDVIRLGDGTCSVVVNFETTPAELPKSAADIQNVSSLAHLRRSLEEDRADLQSIFAFSESMAAAPEGDCPQFYSVLFTSLLNVFPKATHACLVLVDEETGEIERMLAYSREDGMEAAGEHRVVSSTLVRVVVNAKDALRFEFPPSSGEPGRTVAASGSLMEVQSATVQELGISSAICAPVCAEQRVIGVIELDVRDASMEDFTTRDLQLLMVCGNIVAGRILSDRTRQMAARSHEAQLLMEYLQHDLSTPVTVVCGPLEEVLKWADSDPNEILGNADAAKTIIQCAVIAARGAPKLRDLVSASYALLQDESGSYATRLQRTRVSPRTIIKDVIAVYTAFAKKRNTELVCEVPEDLPDVWVDRIELERALGNLTTNALKYAPGNPVTFRAEVREDAPGMVVFSVCDQGPGIPKDYQEWIFSPFGIARYLAEEEKRHAAGEGAGRKFTVGLGLSFCKMMTEAHGGWIKVDSDPVSRPGTTFMIALPAVEGSG